MVFLRQSVDPVNTHRHVSRAQPAKVSRAQPAKAMAQDRRHGRPRPPAEPKSHPRPENDGRPPPRPKTTDGRPRGQKRRTAAPRIKTTDGRPGGGRPPPELEALRLTDGHFSGRPSAAGGAAVRRGRGWTATPGGGRLPESGFGACAAPRSARARSARAASTWGERSASVSRVLRRAARRLEARGPWFSKAWSAKSGVVETEH